MINVAVHGASGRMGRSVIEVLADDPEARLGAALERAGHPALGQDAGLLAGKGELGIALDAELELGLRGVDVVIDFSTPAAAQALFDVCARKRVPLVSGTTGMDAVNRAALDRLAQTVPVLATANFSVGINLLYWLCERTAEAAGPDFDLEIIEMHHKHKQDAPSGTALRMAEVLARVRGTPLNAIERHGRVGQVGPRPSGELGIHALRGGDVVGDHTLVLAGPGERIEITHRAHNRSIFARGALRAAHWVAGREPGLYDMADVLGIR